MIGNRLVAVVDILGFSALVEKKPVQELMSLVSNLFNFSNEISSNITFSPGPNSKEEGFSKSFKPGVCQFSDTILFWSDVIEDNPEDISFRKKAQTANLFLSLVSNFIGASLISFVPLRAGVSFGETYIDSSKSIYIGEAIVRAHKLEMNQEWIGAAVDTIVPKNLSTYGHLTDYTVPFKNSTSSGHALDWTRTLPSPKRILEAFAVINEGLSNNHEKNISQKYENTKKFMIEMLKNTTTGDGKSILEQLQ